MLKRKLLFPVILATAAGAPYLVMENGWSNAAKEKLQGLWPSGEPAGTLASAPATDGAPGLDAPEFKSEFTVGPRAENPRSGPHQLLTGPPVTHLSQIFRFDVRPKWVTDRWPRVTTTLAESGLEGLRVPVVTGTRIDDLAGSLTYYFDRNHRVQRLSFEGYTGDDRRLVELVTRYYGLRAEPTLDASMLVARWNGVPTSVMQVVRAPVIDADSPHCRLHVLLELNRPSAYYGLSPRFMRLLDVARHSQRW